MSGPLENILAMSHCLLVLDWFRSTTTPRPMSTIFGRGQGKIRRCYTNMNHTVKDDIDFQHFMMLHIVGAYFDALFRRFIFWVILVYWSLCCSTLLSHKMQGAACCRCIHVYEFIWFCQRYYNQDFIQILKHSWVHSTFLHGFFCRFLPDQQLNKPKE